MPTIPSSLSDEDTQLVETLLSAKGFSEPTQTQTEAFDDGLLSSGNHLLVAETGNGKTFCAEALTQKALNNDKRVAYLVPSIRLRTEKREGIKDWVDDDITVESGRYAYRNADVIVNTFDSFFQAILHNSGNIRQVDQVILDDFHEIYGDLRGPALEKTISAINYYNIPVFAMSATLGNPDTLSRWFNATLTVSTEERSAPIDEHPLQDDRRTSRKEIVRDILQKETQKGPFMVFNRSKNLAANRLEAIVEAKTFKNYSSRDFEDEVTDIVGNELGETHKKLIHYLKHGVAFHHSALESELQDYIADLIKTGDIICISCTPTLAYGFDAPIQSVIVADLQRFDWTVNATVPVGVYEYVQWIGRAARAGYGYDEGYAYPLFNDPETLEQFQIDTQPKDKELEDVTTHIESSKERRILLLELISYGWDTAEDIDEFLQNTLYWEEIIGPNPAPGTRKREEEELARLRDDTLTWLRNYDFIENKRTSDTIKLTSFGNAALDFTHETWSQHALSTVRSYYEYLANGDLTPPELVAETSEVFNNDISSSIQDEDFVDLLKSAGLEDTDAGQTAGVLVWYWAQGMPLEKIEGDLGIDATYLESTASDIGSLISAAKPILKSIPDRRVPDWYNSFATQVEKGVSPELMVLVDRVKGIGRNTARSVAARLNAFERNPQNDWERTGDTVLDDLYTILYKEWDGDKQLFKDYVLEQAPNVGKIRRQRLMETLEDWEHGSQTPVGVTTEMLEEGNYAGAIDEDIDEDDVSFEPASSDSNARLSDFT